VLTLENECDDTSVTITYTVEAPPCEGGVSGTCTGTTIGTWNWTGNNSILTPMGDGEMSYDGGDVALFSNIDSASIDRGTAILDLEAPNVVCLSNGDYKVFGTIASTQNEGPYYSIYWDGGATGAFCAFGEEGGGTVTMKLVS
jgi:hypothetical protein